MQTYQIEKGIPIPPSGWYNGKWTGILLKMEPGDSFSVATDSDRRSVVTSAKHHKIKVISRKIENNGYRIWRIGQE